MQRASERTRCNRHKLKHKKFHLKLRKNNSIVMVIENWSILSREIVESLSLDKFKS